MTRRMYLANWETDGTSWLRHGDGASLKKGQEVCLIHCIKYNDLLQVEVAREWSVQSTGDRIRIALTSAW